MYHGFSKLWIIVIATVFLTVGVFVWQYFSAPEEMIENKTTDWKIYKNEDAGFEVKYPRDWTIKIIDEKSISFYETNAPLGFYGNPAFPIILTMYAKPQQLSIDQWIKQNKGDLILSGKEAVIIDEVPGIKFIEAGLVEFRAVYVGKGTSVFNLYTDKDSEYLIIFDLILSTFKFLD